VRAALGELRRAASTCLVLFVLFFAFWAGSEGRAPGRQYPDPWVPCTFLALLFAVPAYALSRRWRRRRGR
jgi:hypothetical protein